MAIFVRIVVFRVCVFVRFHFSIIAPQNSKQMRARMEQEREKAKRQKR